MRLLIVAICLLFSGFAIAQTSDLGKTTPTMLENKGQVSNSDGTPADHVLFYMNTPQLDFYLTKTGISYVFKKIEIIPEEGDGRTDPKHRQEKTTVYRHRVDVTAMGAKISPDKAEVEYSDDRTVSIYNGLVPEGLENMKPVRTVTIKEVYPGIDWQFVVQDENIKYNFILHQGADLNSIKLRFDGQNKLSIENDRLIINTAYGTLTEEPLVSFLSTGESVNIKQNLQENLLTFTADNLPALQNGQTLTIDPPLVWATFFGGTGVERVLVIERSLDGFVYMLLEVLSTDFPVLDSTGIYYQPGQGGAAGTYDIGIIKFNDSGKLVWSTYYGGSGNDVPYNMFCNNNLLVVVGYTKSADFPKLPSGFPGAYNNTTMRGTQDGFVIAFSKLNLAMDQRIWATYLGGYSNYDVAWDCSIKNNNLYVVGATYHDSLGTEFKPYTSIQFPIMTKAGAYNQNTISYFDLFITEFNLMFNMTWSTYYGGNIDDNDPTFDIDSIGRIGIAFTTYSTNLPVSSTMPGSYAQSYSALADVAFTLFDSNGQKITHTYLSGSNYDYPEDLICNKHNEWLITGSTKSNNFPVANNIGSTLWFNTLTGSYNAFLLKLDSTIALDYSTYYGSGTATGYGLTIDSHDNLYLVGSTKGNLFTYNPLDGSYVDSTINSTTVHDGFLLELNASYNPKWATVIGGSGDDPLYDIRVSPNDHVFVAGYSKSPAATLPLQNPGNGAWFDDTLSVQEALILKFVPCPEDFDTIWAVDSVCYGETIDIYATGSMTYNWSIGSTNDSIQVNVVSDTTIIVVATYLTCIERDTVFIKVKPLPVITFTGDSSVCLNDSMHLGVDGGINYIWENGFATDSISFLPAASETLTVTVTNSYGCTAQDSIQTTVFPLPVPLITGDNTPCLHDTTSLSASGGVSFEWSNAATTPTIDIAWNSTGTFDYNVIATDLNGCSDTAFFTATVTNLPEFWLGNDTIICDLTSITLDPGIAGANYNWSTGAVTQTLDVSSANTYWLDLNDANNCHFRDTIDIAVQALPDISFSGTDTTCFESSITMTATAPTGISYLWSNGMNTSTITFTPAASGLDTISVTVSDALTCSKTDSLEFMVYPLPLPVIAGNATPCLHDTTTLTASGGISYEWSSGATTTSVDIPFNSMGTYEYFTIATDIHGCSDTAFYTANVLPLPVFDLGADTTICESTSISLHPGITGAIYDWSTSETTQSINVSLANTYHLEITGMNGCRYSDSITVAVQPYPTITFGGDTTVCYSHPITITASGGVSYVWENSLSGDSIVFTPLSDDTLSVLVTDIYGCSSTDSISFEVLPLPTPNISGDTEICQFDTTTLTASGGITYQWSTGQNTSTASILPSVTGINQIYVIATGANMCYDTAFHQITVHALPAINLGPDTTICEGTSLLLDAANSGSTYNWNTGASSQTLTITAAGTYFVSVTDANTCENTDSIIISTQPYADASITDISYVCLNGSPFSFVAAQGGGSWSGDGITNASSGEFNPAVAGVGNSIIVYTISGMCGDKDSTTIEVADIPFIDYTLSDETCPGYNDGTLILEISGGTSPYFYDLSGTTITDTTINLAPDGYLLTVTDSRGCMTSDSVIIHAEDTPCGEVELFIPNIFSPNGDLENDVLFVRSNFIETMAWYIYDRYGEKVFESKDINLGWDGEFEGQKVQNGVYFWHIKATMIDGSVIEREGNVTVVR
ncbi:MAG: gliding motility-associated C-terminal domain-containing protein [Bacteroidales bacterium]